MVSSCNDFTVNKGFIIFTSSAFSHFNDSSPHSSKLFVDFPIADKTNIGISSGKLKTMLATSLILSALATDEPPNFITTECCLKDRPGVTLRSVSVVSVLLRDDDDDDDDCCCCCSGFSITAEITLFTLFLLALFPILVVKPFRGLDEANKGLCTNELIKAIALCRTTTTNKTTDRR